MRELTFVVALIFVAGIAGAQPAPPAGNQFQVNTHTTGPQRSSVVARTADGSFLVVWESDTAFTADTSDIRARLFSSDGTPVGSDFLVNTFTTDRQQWPDVASLPSGEFVVVWHSYGSASGETDFSIQRRRFAADATPLENDFQVNIITTGPQMLPVIAADPAGGGFVVVWVDGSQGAGRIVGQRFSSNGAFAGPAFQVNSHSTYSQSEPAVATNANGDFVVVWNGFGSPGDDDYSDSVKGRRFLANGTPQGDDFQVNTYTTQMQAYADVAFSQNGEFLVVWTGEGSTGSDDSMFSIQGRRFASDGTAFGDDFQINSFTQRSQRQPVVVGEPADMVGPSGEWVVAWQSDRSPGEYDVSIQSRRLGSDGTPMGQDFEVNTYTTDHQGAPAIAIDAFGDFTITWDSFGFEGTDMDPPSVHARRFLGLPFLIFADDFESGDTNRWSSADP